MSCIIPGVCTAGYIRTRFQCGRTKSSFPYEGFYSLPADLQSQGGGSDCFCRIQIRFLKKSRISGFSLNIQVQNPDKIELFLQHLVTKVFKEVLISQLHFYKFYLRCFRRSDPDPIFLDGLRRIPMNISKDTLYLLLYKYH